MTLQELKDQNKTYYTQRNNLFNPMAACFPTSMAMGIDSMGGRLSILADVPIGGMCIAKGVTERSQLKLDDQLWLLCNSDSTREAVAKSMPTVSDEQYIRNYAKDQLNEVLAVEAWVCNQYIEGVKAQVNFAITKDRIELITSQGGCVILATHLYSGHMICCFGVEGDNYVIGDPFGDYFDGLKPQFSHYPISMGALQHCFAVELTIG